MTPTTTTTTAPSNSSATTQIGDAVDQPHKSFPVKVDSSVEDLELGDLRKPSSDDQEQTSEKKRSWLSHLPFIGARPPPPPPPATFDDAAMTPELQAGIWSRHVFTWVQPMLILGSQRPLTATDVWKLNPDTASSEMLSRKINVIWDRRCAEADAWNAKIDSGDVGPSLWRRVNFLIGRGSETEWRAKSGRKQASLVWTCNEVFLRWFWIGGVYKLVGDCTQICSPLLVKYIINFVAQSHRARAAGLPEPNIGRGIGAAIGLSLMLLVASLCNHQFFYRGTSTGVLLRGALIACIYERGLKLTGKARVEGFGNGRLVNTISTDVSRIDFCCGFLHLIWVAPVQVAICLILLSLNLGPAAVAGFAFFVIITPLQTKTMALLFKERVKAMVWTDQRAKLLSELLNGMKLIKFFAWEIPYLNRLNTIRRKELAHIKNLLITRAANMAVAFTLPVLASVISFTIYGAMKGGLVAADVFSSLALFQLLRLPLMMLPMALSSATDAKNAFGRLEPLFHAETLKSSQNIDPTAALAIDVQNASFSWDAAPPQEEPKKLGKAEQKKNKKDAKKIASAGGRHKSGTSTPALVREEAHADASKGNADEGETMEQIGLSGREKVPGLAGDETVLSALEKTGKDEVKPEQNIFSFEGIDLKVPVGQLVAIVGSVGSGKSSLLQALLGEMKRTAGSVTFNGKIGYCPQTAWIQNATIRENILFGQPFDEERYWAAVKAASLEADLEILSGGDSTSIGEKGINLSGGQRQRVSMARLIYFNADIVLLDDPLSAVDAHVGKALFNNAISGVLKGKTRVLVTHQLHFLSAVDYIITVADGTLAEQGTYEELIARDGAFSKLMYEFGNHEDEQGDVEGEAIEEVEEKAHPKEDKVIDRSRLTNKKGDKLISEEERYTGAVGAKVVKDYFKAGRGSFLVPLLVLFICTSQVATVLTSYFLVWWQEDKFGLPVGAYMGLYGALAVAQALTTFLMGAVFAYLTFFASVTLHRNAIERVMKAPQAFFDTTPLGRIMNRFSKDMDSIDNMLGDGFRMLASTLSQILGSVILIAVVQPYFLIACVVVFYLLYKAASFYRMSARELKRIDSILRSSIYSNFSESLTGLSTIRAYGEMPRFIKQNTTLIDLENRAYYLTIANQRWLGPRVDGLGNALVFTCAIIGITVRSLSPSEVGLALGYVVGIVQSLAWLVRQVAEVENDLTSAERILHYANELELEAAHDVPETQPPKEWPQEGKISFQNVHMSYRPGLPNVLKNLSMEVRPAEKIGVVGRTGAGKSSIMMALFRLVELNGGKIEVDGIDISKLGLTALRSGLSIIPQEPLLFSGTLRSNLDPFGAYDDQRLWDAMKRAYLVDDESTNSSQPRFTLDTVIEDEGLNLSVGERSLVSLARALVRNAKIIILDECTASVDLETDAKIQKTIRTEFSDKTLLTIAHRLLTILSYDRICVMDFGEVVEFGTPLELFQNESGIFRAMCDQSNIGLEEIKHSETLRDSGC